VTSLTRPIINARQNESKGWRAAPVNATGRAVLFHMSESRSRFPETGPVPQRPRWPVRERLSGPTIETTTAPDGAKRGLGPLRIRP